MLLIRFFTEKVEDRTASIAANRLIYKDQERCHVMIPGQREDIREHILDDDRLRTWEESTDPVHKDFLTKYRLWKDGKEAPVNGTPLELSGFLSPAQVENLKAPPLGLRTVEQLADMSDGQVMGMPMGMTVRDQAKKFIEAQTGPAHVSAKMMEQEATIARQQSQISDLSAQLSELLRRIPAMTDSAPAPQRSGVTPADDDDIGPPPPGSIRADASLVAARSDDDDQPVRRGPGRPPKFRPAED